MNRQDYVYQLAGRITDKKTKKKKDGKLFWQLAVIIQDKPVNKINVFDNGLAKKTIWQEIEESKYIGKEYLFYCKNFMGTYFLVDWKLLENHGSN